MNNRRKLIVALGAGALTFPLPSFAQQAGKVWRVGFLAFPTRPSSASAANTRTAESIQAAGQKRGVTVVPASAGTPQEIEATFSTMTREKVGALIVSLNPLFFSNEARLRNWPLNTACPPSLAIGILRRQAVS